MGKQLDVICLSHLRWGRVLPRPGQLMTRCARTRRVFYFEEPVFDAERPRLAVTKTDERLYVVVPHLAREARGDATVEQARALLDELCASFDIETPILWFCTPAALEYSRHLRAALVVFDCTDELSGAPPRMLELEDELLRRAELVFTGAEGLYQAKRARHANVHDLPSSVDLAHFSRARLPLPDPADQAPIRFPRLGFFGVFDDAVDLTLIDRLAFERSEWQLVMIGIDDAEPARLPARSNIHYLGQKHRKELPGYLSSWQVAVLPFALEATPPAAAQATLECLAAGRPVVSTPVAGVVRPYGEQGLVRVADADGFADAVEEALSESIGRRRAKVDTFLDGTTWEQIWSKMAALVDERLRAPSSKVA